MAAAVEMLGTSLPRAQVAETAVNVTGSSGTKLAFARHQQHRAFPFLTGKYKTKQQHSAGQQLNTFNTNQRTKQEKKTLQEPPTEENKVCRWSSGVLVPFFLLGAVGGAGWCRTPGAPSWLQGRFLVFLVCFSVTWEVLQPMLLPACP